MQVVNPLLGIHVGMHGYVAYAGLVLFCAGHEKPLLHPTSLSIFAVSVHSGDDSQTQRSNANKIRRLITIVFVDGQSKQFSSHHFFLSPSSMD